jgi:hypothetical protein
VVLAGCSKGVTVSGTTVFPSDLKLEKTDAVEIIFVPETKGALVPVVSFIPDDKTLVARQVLPGKYKIAVKITPYMGLPESAKRVKEFEGFNKTFDRSTTKLAYEATSDGNQSIVLDLAKGKVTKN